MKINFLPLCQAFFIVSLLISSISSSNYTIDQDALLAFKNAMASNSEGTLVNWSSNMSACNWTGVTCGTKHRRVTALNVSGFRLGGAIAPHLGNLTFLQSLDISNNSFTGHVPSELSKLRRLRAINMGFNKLTGEVSSWFGILSQLQHISLQNNTFTGTIPPSLSNTSGLQALDMRNNLLEGNIPDEIGNLSSLETLYLGGNKLTGSIPNGAFNMASLVTLSVRYNGLSGKIPDGICRKSKLKTINLSGNQFYGEIPANIGNCTELEMLYFPINHFDGMLPTQLWSLTALKILALDSNNFTGSLSKNVGNLTSLTVLGLYGNNLTGELPEEVGNLRFIQQFSVFGNNLWGSIPPSIFNLSTLIDLELGFNDFSGTLPMDTLLSLPNLQQLYLSANDRLTGGFPTFIANASQLVILEMEINSFTGKLPNLSNLRFLRSIRIWDNNFTGGLEFLPSLNNCPYLEELNIGLNPLGGVLLPSIGNLSTSLETFSANGCNLEGVIPSEIGNITSLIEIFLYENQLSGSIPTKIGSLKQLQRLYLGGNQLEGQIPNEVCEMDDLGVLEMGQNMLTYQIPECLGRVKSLRNINFGFNRLNSTAPSSLWDLSDILTMNLSSNRLSGQLSPRIGNLKAMYELDLSGNQFLGDITGSIGDCSDIQVLNLSNNKFGGSIPLSLGNIKGLRTLDLSHNDISGLIPKSLEDLTSLQYLNLSYNKLEGEIPNGGGFLNFSAQSFAQNSALCGAKRFLVPPCPEYHKGSRSRSRKFVHLIKYIVPSFLSVILISIVIFMFVKRRNQKKMAPPPNTSIGTPWRRVSYIELVQGTSSFDESALLGRGSFGSVYKGILSDGLVVAAKVFNLQLERAMESFDTESRILSSIRHRNLVQIIGCCANTEFKALILEYMPNGSLEKWLYSDNYCLDFMQRLDIAIDVAQALEYLHHGNTFPIVHCDIKPSNVLLDEDMTGRVADFGISKLFDNGEDMIQTKTMATIGYSAPEYGSEGKVSTNGDVYSYGIMLLEMFTQKKPTDDMFNGEMSLRDWVMEAMQENAISKIMATGLVSREDQCLSEKEQCVSSIFDVAMKCVATTPEERMKMIEVVAALHKIKAKVTTQVVQNGQLRR